MSPVNNSANNETADDLTATPIVSAIKFPTDSIFSNLNFLKLWGAQIFSQSAIAMLNFSLAIFAYKATGSNQTVALLILCYGAAAFIFGAFAGVIVDRRGKKEVLFYSTVSRFLLAFLLLFLTESIVLAAMGTFLLNAITQFFFPAESATMPIIVNRKNLLTANSLYMLSYYASQLFGYVLGGIVLEKVGFGNSVATVSLLFLIAAILIYNLKFHEVVKEKELSTEKIWKKVIQDFKYGIKYIKKTPVIKQSLIYLAIVQISVGIFMSLIPGYAYEVLGLKPEEASVYLVIPLGVGVVSGVIILNTMRSRKYKFRRIIDVGVIGAFLGLTLLAVNQRIPMNEIKKFTHTFNGFQQYLPAEVNKFLGVDVLFFAMLFMVLLGIANGIIVVSNTTRLQLETDESVRGRVFGVLQLVVTTVGFIPIILGGFFADRIGINLVLAVVGTAILVLHLTIRKIDIKSVT